MPEISEVTTESLELPLKGQFETAKGRKSVSPAVIVEVKLSNGVCGLGSATPVNYVTNEDVESVLSAIDYCRPDLVGLDASCYLPIFETLAISLPKEHSARASLEIAVLDAFCKLYNLPMYRFFGGYSAFVETDVTIPITDPDKCCQLAEEATSQGFQTLKVKVGTDIEEDLARVIAVNRGAPNAKLRVDANQGFTPAGAVSFLRKLQEIGVPVELMEQPVDRDDFDGLAYVTKHSPIPIYADESDVTTADVLKLIELEAVDGINVKLMKCGISGALEIIAICKAARKEIMLGSMIETGVGLSAAVHLACGTGAFHEIDLDSHLLVVPEESLFEGSCSFDGPRLAPNGETAGHGITRFRLPKPSSGQRVSMERPSISNLSDQQTIG